MQPIVLTPLCLRTAPILFFTPFEHSSVTTTNCFDVFFQFLLGSCGGGVLARTAANHQGVIKMI